jgi:putative transposase
LSAAHENLPDIVRDYRRFTSEKISALLQEARDERLVSYFATAARFDKKGNQSKIWQSGSHPEAIEGGRFFGQKLNYIHQNPARKGVVRNPEDWLYSSVRNYYLNDHSIIKIDMLD